MATRREPVATIIRGQLAAPETKSTRDARLVLVSNENGDVLVTSGVENSVADVSATSCIVSEGAEEHIMEQPGLHACHRDRNGELSVPLSR